MKLLFNYLIFPGFLFSLFWGGLGWWVERKLTARFQYRVGPPWYQNFIDILKLFFKEQVIPKDSFKPLFIASPIISFSSVLLVILFITQALFLKESIFQADLLVVFYLLITPSLFTILGGFSSANPLASCGAAREVKLMLSYEFIFVTSLIVVLIKSKGNLSLEGIISLQKSFPFLGSISGFIAFILGLIWLQAKMGLVPFDVSEAEQEIMAGIYIEYGGPLLGFFKLTRALFYFILPLFLLLLFWADNLGWHLIYKYLIIILLISVIKNTNPRLRADDIVKFFWFLLFPLGLLAIILAILGF